MTLAMDDMRAAAEDPSLTHRAVVARADIARAMGKYGENKPRTRALWVTVSTAYAPALLF